MNIIVFDSCVFLRSIESWLVCVGAMCTWSIVFIVVEISRDMQNDGQKISIQKITHFSIFTIGSTTPKTCSSSANWLASWLFRFCLTLHSGRSLSLISPRTFQNEDPPPTRNGGIKSLARRLIETSAEC